MFWIDRDEAETKRVFLISSGTKITFERYPPHGNWKLSFERGSVPAQLQGEWLEFELFFRKTKTYLATRRYPATIVEELDLSNAP